MVGNSSELCFTPATELGRLIRDRQLSPVELAGAVLDRIEHLNPRLNAFITVTADLAREQAQAAEARARGGALIGPLDGIPYSIKDLEPTAGIRTTYGSKFTEHFVPAEDGSVPRRLKPTGAVMLGKTNTPHLGYKDMCDSFVAPPCRNPWKLDRTSGASSGGAGAGVAAGLGPLAHGSDGAGSIRIPASLCGIFGLKPSFARVAAYPKVDLWAARSHNGPMSRTVRDAALMLNAMAGPDPADPLSIDVPPVDYLAACEGDLKGLRVAYSQDLGYAAVDPEVRRITRGAALRLAEAGCEVEERDPGWPNPAEFHATIYEVEMGATIDERAAEHPKWVEPSLMRMVERSRRTSILEYRKAVMARTVFYNYVMRFFADYDLLLTPQMPVGAWTVEPESWPVEIEGRPTPGMLDHLHFTHPFNLTGQPAATVPCGFTSEGLPVGLQIVGRWHADATVLRASACFEAIQPWARHRPPID